MGGFNSYSSNGGYGRGTKSQFVSDQSGLVYPYLEGRFQKFVISNLQSKPIITNWYVHKDEYDPDEEIRVISVDAQALRNPRVDNKDLPPTAPVPNTTDAMGYIWDSKMTNTWAPGAPLFGGANAGTTPQGMYPSWPTISIGNMSSINGVATMATIQRNNYSAGNTILVQYTLDPAFSGVFTIASVVDQFTFTYNLFFEPQNPPPANLSVTGGKVQYLIESSEDF